MSPLLFTSKRMSANISHYKPPPILTFGKGSIYYYVGPERPKKKRTRFFYCTGIGKSIPDAQEISRGHLEKCPEGKAQETSRGLVEYSQVPTYFWTSQSQAGTLSSGVRPFYSSSILPWPYGVFNPTLPFKLR